MHTPDKKENDLSLLEEMGYEKQDIDVQHLPKHAIGLFVSIGVVIVIAYFIMGIIQPGSNKIPAGQEPAFRVMPKEPQPLLQSNTTAHQDMVDMHKKEEEHMNGYGWVGEDRSKVYVPIVHAIELVLAEGLPTRTGATGIARVKNEETPETPTEPVTAPTDATAPTSETTEPVGGATGAASTGAGH